MKCTRMCNARTESLFLLIKAYGFFGRSRCRHRRGCLNSLLIFGFNFLTTGDSKQPRASWKS